MIGKIPETIYIYPQYLEVDCNLLLRSRISANCQKSPWELRYEDKAKQDCTRLDKGDVERN